MQVAIHAIGDQANDDVLAMYSHAQRNNSHLASPRRHRIEHVQHVSGSDAMLAFSQLQTVAVVNPLHLLSDMHIMTDRLGRQRGSAEHAFAYNAMLKVSRISNRPFGTHTPASAASVECFPFTAVKHVADNTIVTKVACPQACDYASCQPDGQASLASN